MFILKGYIEKADTNVLSAYRLVEYKCSDSYRLYVILCN